MSKKLSISIGISALNEEISIPLVLRDILDQKLTSCYIKEIIVISDGSTDHTVSTVKSIKSKLIKLIIGNERKGLASRVVQLTKISKGDILVLVDADIRMPSDCLEEISKSFSRDSQIGFAGGNVLPEKPTTLVSKAVYASVEGYINFSHQFNNGNNIYTAKGAMLVLSSKFAKTVSIPKNVFAQDHYLYLFAKKNGFKYAFIPDAKVYYHLPKTLADHIKQNKRFEATKGNLKDVFGDMAIDEYQKDQLLFYSSLLRIFLRKPILSILIYLINIYCKISANLNYKKYSYKWSKVRTTKF